MLCGFFTFSEFFIMTSRQWIKFPENINISGKFPEIFYYYIIPKSFLPFSAVYAATSSGRIFFTSAIFSTT